MKRLKIYQAAILEGFASFAVLPPIIFAAVLGGVASVNVVGWLTLTILP